MRGGADINVRYCAGPAGPQAPPVVCPDQNNPSGLTGYLRGELYGEFSDWTPINLFRSWIKENDPLREVTAKSGNFNWSNPAAWSDAFSDAAHLNGAVPNNTSGPVPIDPNQPVDADQAARYYHVTLSNPGTIRVDMDPTIDMLKIAGTHSETPHAAVDAIK